MVAGPRAVGKTTTAARQAASIARLDIERHASAFRVDPDAALSAYREPVLLDEWHFAPGVLGAVKRAVDADPSPGRFIVTGSVSAPLETPVWPGTGRFVWLDMLPLTVAEQSSLPARPLLDRLASGQSLRPADGTPDLRGYVELAMLGGLPQAVQAKSPAARRRVLAGYIRQLTNRDARQVAAVRNPDLLRRFLEACASSSAGLPSGQTLAATAQINASTVRSYRDLLKNLMIIDELPPWHSNRLKRLTNARKLVYTDTSLMAAALGVATDAVLRDGGLIGQFIETFAIAQIRAELPVSESQPRLRHLRDQQGRHEIDLIAEIGGTRIVGIEIKASGNVTRKSARHLRWLSEAVGDRFLAGVVLHTGPTSFKIADKITAAPISTLWASDCG